MDASTTEGTTIQNSGKTSSSVGIRDMGYQKMHLERLEAIEIRCLRGVREVTLMAHMWNDVTKSLR